MSTLSGQSDQRQVSILGQNKGAGPCTGEVRQIVSIIEPGWKPAGVSTPGPQQRRRVIDTSPLPRRKASTRITDRRSFARALAVARAIVAERHDRPSLVANIACEIAAEIIEGLRQPVDHLNSLNLSRRYQTSRTPTPVALMLLGKERLWEIPQRRKSCVASLQMDEVRALYRPRAALFELITTDVERS